MTNPRIRAKRLNVMATDAEHALWFAHAAAAGEGFSQLVRRALREQIARDRKAGIIAPPPAEPLPSLD